MVVYTKYNAIFLCLLIIYWVYVVSLIIIKRKEIQKKINESTSKNIRIPSSMFLKIRFHTIIAVLMSIVYCVKNNKIDEYMSGIVIGAILFCILVLSNKKWMC